MCVDHFIKICLQNKYPSYCNEKIFSIKFFLYIIFFYDGFTDMSFKSTFYGNYTLQLLCNRYLVKRIT